MTPAAFGELDDYQIRHLLLRPRARERDASEAAHASPSSGFEAFLKLCRDQGMSEAEAQEALQKAMALNTGKPT